MTKKAKTYAILISLLMIGGLGFELFKNQITPHVSAVIVGEESTQKKGPVISFHDNLIYGVCPDQEQLKYYEDLYLNIIKTCRDTEGKNILDKKHISYEEIDWTKPGKHTIQYKIHDDKGFETKAECIVELTEGIDTGH